MASSGDPAFRYDAYISYSRPDVEWARRLAADLTGRGLVCFSDIKLGAGEDWRATIARALDSSTTLVVLWGPSSEHSEGMRLEIAQFEAFGYRTSHERRIFPVILGGAGVLSTAPSGLLTRHALILSVDAYEAGPESQADEWLALVGELGRAIDGTGRDPSGDLKRKTETPKPTCSDAAPVALSAASDMLTVGVTRPEQLRSAALLGALFASATSDMAPTTGDVVRLIAARHAEHTSALGAIGAAAEAAGLEPLPAFRGRVTEEALRLSPAAPILELAVGVAVQAQSEIVHLRHVLAVGVHSEVPQEVFACLGVSLSELRTSWRSSLARTWPKESPEAWDAILDDKLSDGPPIPRRLADLPPSAYVDFPRFRRHLLT